MNKHSFRIFLIAVLSILFFALLSCGQGQTAEENSANESLEPALRLQVERDETLKGTFSVSCDWENLPADSQAVREICILSFLQQDGSPLPPELCLNLAEETEILMDTVPLQLLSQDHQMFGLLFRAFFRDEELQGKGSEATGKEKLSFEIRFSDPDHLPEKTIIQLDVLLQSGGELSGGDWKTVASDLQYLFGGDGLSLSAITDLPVLDHTRTFDWIIAEDKAILLGIGNVRSEKLVIPEEIFLSPADLDGCEFQPEDLVEAPYFSHCGEGYLLVNDRGDEFDGKEQLLGGTQRLMSILVEDKISFYSYVQGDEFPLMRILMEDGSEITSHSVVKLLRPLTISAQEPLRLYLQRPMDYYREDPLGGTRYAVVVSGDAFHGVAGLKSVAFRDGVEIRKNRMNHQGCGMFEDCASLESVTGIPAAVSDVCRAFLGCTALQSTPELPPAVLDMDECFSGCTQLKLVGPLGSSVRSMNQCFRDCTSLDETPEIPDSVIQMSGCFSGCASLTRVSNLGTGVKEMNQCFLDCVSLTMAPSLPRNVQSLDSCFEGCTSLTQVPELPETLESMDRCFADCTQLSGEVRLPFTLLDSGCSKIETAFSGCSGLDHIDAEYCSDLPESLSSSEVPIHPLYEHVQDGICPWCHFATMTTSIRGLTVVADHYPEDCYLSAVEILEKLPDPLITSCNRLVLTEDLNRYGNVDTWVDGFAMVESYTAYVSAEHGVHLQYIITHELSHCLDYRRFYSHSAAWVKLCDTDGEEAKTQYSREIYSYSGIKLQVELFAIAVGKYYTDSEWLQQHCPGMYEYVEQLFAPAG